MTSVDRTSNPLTPLPSLMKTLRAEWATLDQFKGNRSASLWVDVIELMEHAERLTADNKNLRGDLNIRSLQLDALIKTNQAERDRLLHEAKQDESIRHTLANEVRRLRAALERAEAKLRRKGLLQCSECDKWFTPNMLSWHRCGDDKQPSETKDTR